MPYKDKRLAVIGVSNNPEKFGFRIYRDLRKAGYDVAGVHPISDNVLGTKIYKNLKDVPFVPDLVITVVPPQITEKIVNDCIALGIKEIWMQPGSGSDAAIAKAGKSGMTVIHDSCFMVENGIW